MSRTFFECDSKKRGWLAEITEWSPCESLQLYTKDAEARRKKTQPTEVGWGRRNYLVVVFVSFFTPCLIPLKVDRFPLRFFLCIAFILCSLIILKCLQTFLVVQPLYYSHHNIDLLWSVERCVLESNKSCLLLSCDARCRHHKYNTYELWLNLILSLCSPFIRYC